MTEMDPFLDVSPQNSRLEVMILATFFFALINEYEGVEFWSQIIKATILTCLQAFRICIKHNYSFKIVARKASGATGGWRGLSGAEIRLFGENLAGNQAIRSKFDQKESC